MDITNRVVIITGGKRIGRIVAQRLADRGADLVLSYRGSKTEEFANALKDTTGIEVRLRKLEGEP